MKSIRSLLPLLALAATFPPLAASAQETSLLPVAVLDPEAGDPRLKERGSQLALLVTTQLSTLDGVVTVERQELGRVLEEQELGRSGLVDPAAAARVGHLTGARVLVTGRLFTVARDTTAALKVMSAETGRVFGVAETFPADAAPNATAEKLAAKIGELLRTKRDDLLAKVVSPADRVQRIKQKAGARKLPAVQISIPERHLGPPVADPAAATEIARILQQAGFTLAGDAATADYVIAGEAFSEAGVRHGNLIACKARVEIKVTRRDGGEIVLADRETSWAVDTAEHIAGKLALQDAGAELASRIADAVLAKP